MRAGLESAKGEKPSSFAATRLGGNFIVAMPHLDDPNFRKTVVLICEHNGEGAMGVVVNRPLPFTLGQIYSGQKITGKNESERAVFFGGPVQTEVGFILYAGDDRYPTSLTVSEEVKLGTSLDILSDIAEGKGPGDFLFTLGYAGWSARQLESELARNDWLVVPFDPGLIFNIAPGDRWEYAIRSLGIDPGFLTSSSGSA